MIILDVLGIVAVARASFAVTWIGRAFFTVRLVVATTVARVVVVRFIGTFFVVLVPTAARLPILWVVTAILVGMLALVAMDVGCGKAFL